VGVGASLGDRKCLFGDGDLCCPPRLWRAGAWGSLVRTCFEFLRGLAAGSGEPAPRLGTAHFPPNLYHVSTKLSTVLRG